MWKQSLQAHKLETSQIVLLTDDRPSISLWFFFFFAKLALLFEQTGDAFPGLFNTQETLLNFTVEA